MELYIDTEQADELFRQMKSVLGSDVAERVMQSAIRKTGTRTKKIVAKAVSTEYNITEEQAKADVKRPQTQALNCTIPIEGARHAIGGNTFKAEGGLPGWATLHSGKYRITTEIIRGKTTELPLEMKHQGGNTPWINTAAKDLRGVAFTRKEGTGFPPNNKPYTRVVGIATPQMAENRSNEQIAEDIEKLLIEQITNTYNAKMAKLMTK